MARLQIDPAPYPSQLTIACRAHRVIAADMRLAEARREVIAAEQEAVDAGIPLASLRSAVRVLSGGPSRRLSADAAYIVDAVRSVPIIGVEIGASNVGAFSHLASPDTIAPDTASPDAR